MYSENENTGTVFLVGAGPGDPGLITVRGFKLLQACDVVVYDNLTPDEIILTLPQRIERRYVGKKAGEHSLPQDKINELLVSFAKEGKSVVRLKGGDPYVFGRGGEEARFLKQHGVSFEIVPGVTAGVAGPAYVGIPTTDREKSSFVMFLTGHKAANKEFSSVPWEWVGGAKNGTIVIYMGVAELPGIVEKLLASGMSPDTPAAAIERGTFPTQRLVKARLADLPETAKTSGLTPPSLFVIGNTVDLSESLTWLDHKPLFGLRVLITRPADQADWVYESLRELGAEVLPHPTIATKRGFDADGWEKVNACTSDDRWLLFTSENGVRYFFEQWMYEQGDVRGLAKYKIAAVGAGTARALGQIHLTPDFVPNKATTAAMAQQMTEELQLKSATVVRVRGNLADDRVEAALESAGANVIPLTCYETYTPEWSSEAKTKLFAYPPDVIMFTSGSTVSGLAEVLSAEELSELTDGTTIVSIGPSTSKTIESHGMTVHLEAGTHTIPGIIEELVAYHKENPMGRSK